MSKEIEQTELGKFIESYRNGRNLSIRELAQMAGISHTEVWRLETGERKKPSPDVLKALAPHLGVSYEDLMKKAGYMEDTVEHKGYIEKVYYDEDNRVVDLTMRIRDMYENDSKWASLAYRVSVSNLTDEERELVASQTQNLLEQLLKNKKKK